jgi:hypothetical protein
MTDEFGCDYCLNDGKLVDDRCPKCDAVYEETAICEDSQEEFVLGGDSEHFCDVCVSAFLREEDLAQWRRENGK